MAEKLSDWGVLEDLNLDDLVDQSSMFDNPDNVRAAVSDVRTGAGGGGLGSTGGTDSRPAARNAPDRPGNAVRS